MKIFFVFLCCVLSFSSLTVFAGEELDGLQTNRATVDLRKIFDNYYKTKLMRDEMAKREELIKRKDKEMKAAMRIQVQIYTNMQASVNDLTLNEDEHNRRRQEIASKFADLNTSKSTISKFQKDAVRELANARKEAREQILKDILVVINAKDKSGGYTFDKLSALIKPELKSHEILIPVDIGVNGNSNRLDLTDSIIDQLNTNAPAALNR